MSTPHTCPVCMGRGTVPQTGTLTTTTTAEDTCPACHGACVLWEPAPTVGPFSYAKIGPFNYTATGWSDPSCPECMGCGHTNETVPFDGEIVPMCMLCNGSGHAQDRRIGSERRVNSSARLKSDHPRYNIISRKLTSNRRKPNSMSHECRS